MEIFVGSFWTHWKREKEENLVFPRITKKRRIRIIIRILRILGSNWQILTGSQTDSAIAEENQNCKQVCVPGLESQIRGNPKMSALCRWRRSFY